MASKNLALNAFASAPDGAVTTPLSETVEPFGPWPASFTPLISDAARSSTPSPIAPIGLQCLNASLMKWIAEPCLFSDSTLFMPPGTNTASNMTEAVVSKLLSASTPLPPSPLSMPCRSETTLKWAPWSMRIFFTSVSVAASTPSSARMAIRLLLIVSLTVFSWLRPGDFDTFPFFPGLTPEGAFAPMPAAILFASSGSTLANMSTTLCRISLFSTFPSSKWNALTMWSFSGSDMLFQNSVAWL
jgi:hypothetical protein